MFNELVLFFFPALVVPLRLFALVDKQGVSGVGAKGLRGVHE